MACNCSLSSCMKKMSVIIIFISLAIILHQSTDHHPTSCGHPLHPTTPFPPPPPSSGRIYFGRLIISYKAIFYSMKYNYKCQFIRLIIFYSTGHGKSIIKEIRFISKTQHVQNINQHKKISLSNHSSQTQQIQI